MKKRIYEKPKSTSLDSLDVVHGACWSGNIEQKLVGCQPTGSTAVDPCNVGGKVYERNVCTNGDFAGASCFSGSDAG